MSDNTTSLTTTTTTTTTTTLIPILLTLLTPVNILNKISISVKKKKAVYNIESYWNDQCNWDKKSYGDQLICLIWHAGFTCYRDVFHSCTLAVLLLAALLLPKSVM